MRIVLDRDHSTPVYLQIFDQIRRQILSGALMPGFRLPPERKLAESLDVNRSTVLNAYRELKAEGLVASHVGQGTVVLPYLHEQKSTIGSVVQEPAWNQVFSQYSNSLGSLIVKDLLSLANRRDVISFATGIASPVSGPVEILAGLEQELVGMKNYKAMMPSPVEGFTSLREAIAGFMQKRGVYCHTEEVMLLSGSQQGIDLAARIFVDPGDVVVVEEPSFFPAIQVFRAAGARVMGVPVDEGGLQLDMLEQLLQRYRPKLIYTMPNFQNPTGIEMELDRRRQLLELAYKYRVLILEDDAYGDLCYDGLPLPTLKSMDSQGYVIYLSTFSKIVFPGLRLGWMAAHKKIVQKFAAARQNMDLHASSLSQRAVERFMTGGGLDLHLPRVCSDYRKKRDAMLEALLRYAPAGLSWNRPRGGYYIWCRLPEKVTAEKLIPQAAERKVVFVPGTPFYTAEQGQDRIRLNFTFAGLDDIDKGIRCLCEAVKAVIGFGMDYEGETELEMTPIV